MYDVIVVGARCAGAPTAMLLARRGHRVLVLDRSTFPSDILSTHFLQAQGSQYLQDWGLLDRVMATGCPPITKLTVTLGEMSMEPPQDASLPPAICPRRTVLDKILVDAAREAGAEVREGFSVSEIVKDGERVVRVRGRAKAGGGTVEERATIVVGADGTHSLVARSVDAPEYNAYPSLTCAYYTYWSGVEMEGAELYMAQDTGVLAFPTNDGQVCIAVGRQNSEFAAFRQDIEGNYMKYLEVAAPALAARVREGKRAGRWLGTADVPNFFRKPYGPGWALVGDAGYHKDPVTGLGIMDAFRDADLLAAAIEAGLSVREPMDEALAGYEQKRNEIAAPLYEMTVKMASMPPLEEVMQSVPQQAPSA